MQAEREICAFKPWPFLETTFSFPSVASTQYYDIPANVEKIKEVSVVVGSFRSVLKLAPNKQFWDNLNASTQVESNYAQWYFPLSGQIGVYPAPSDATATYTVQARLKPIDLVKADYTTGNIVSIANGATAVTGSGTSWTSGMVGSYMRITPGNGANLGDGVWYKISAVGSTTTLTLDTAYQGASISAGSANYTIGQSSTLPEAHDILPVYRAAQMYFTSIQPMPSNADRFKTLYDEGFKVLSDSYSSKTDDPLIEDWPRFPFINPNNAPYITL